MSLTTEWDDPAQTILRLDIGGQYTLDELKAAMTHSIEIGTQSGHTACFIMNVLPGTRIPTDPGMFSYARDLMTKQANQTQLVVYVAPSMFAAAIGNTFLKVYKRFGDKFLIADSLDKARALIREHQAKSLP